MTTVDSIIERVQRQCAEKAANEYPIFSESLLCCESPIETIMAHALHGVFVFRGLGCWVSPGQSIEMFKELAGVMKPVGVALHCAIAAQIKVSGYVIDFVVMLGATDKGGRPTLIAVECDGHEFHDKTKEQAARDKARDRRLAEAGLQVLRFTGSEIWRDAVTCGEQVRRLITATHASEFDLWVDRVGTAA